MFYVVIIHQDGTSEKTGFKTYKEAEEELKEKLKPGSTDRGYIYESDE